MTDSGKLPVKTTPVANGSEQPRNKGRPSAYTEELAERICVRIASGETLISVCRDDDMPEERTVRGWDFDGRIGKDCLWSNFAPLYARAKELRLEHEVDRLEELTRPQLGVVRTEKETLLRNGQIIKLREEKFGDNVAARALEADILKWRIARMGWRIYGTKEERLAQQQDAEAESNTQRIIVEGGLPDEEPYTPPDDPPQDVPPDEPGE